jgi:hypothetical protein
MVCTGISDAENVSEALEIYNCEGGGRFGCDHDHGTIGFFKIWSLLKTTTLTITIIPFLLLNGHGQIIKINRYFNNFNKFQQQKVSNLEMVMIKNCCRRNPPPLLPLTSLLHVFSSCRARCPCILNLELCRYIGPVSIVILLNLSKILLENAIGQELY